jgi:hypothetical protein
MLDNYYIIIDFVDPFQLNKCDTVLESLGYKTDVVKNLNNDEISAILAVPYLKESHEIQMDIHRLFNIMGIRSLLLGKSESIFEIYSNGTRKEYMTSNYKEGSIFSYMINNYPVSIIEKKEYKYPKSPSDLSKGMVVEYLSNGKWVNRIVNDPVNEWKKMWEVMSKYNKVRYV